MVEDGGSAASSGLPDVFFVVAWLPIGLGARRASALSCPAATGHGRGRFRTEIVSRSFSLLPYAAIAVGVILLVYVGIRDLDTDTGALTAVGGYGRP